MAEILENMSKALADTVEGASTGVVRVEARHRLPATGIVWSADGLIVTAHHVVERDDNITIGFSNGETAPAVLVGRDPTTDLALLRVDKSGLSALPQAAFETAHIGNLVLALGRPGDGIQASLGIVTALEPTERRRRGGSHLEHYLQTSVDMYPGFSGGPLLDMGGKVLGLNTSAMSGVSLAIPTPTIARVVDALQRHGKVRQGYLGVGAQPARLPEAIKTQLGQDTGLLIASIEPGSPADKSGLLLGDILITFDGVALRQLDDLLGLLTSSRVGKTFPTQIVRGGQLQTIEVTVGERE